MRPLPESHDAEQTAAMYALYQKGRTKLEVAREFDVSETTVYRRFAASGLSCRAAGLPRPTEAQVAEWRRLRVDEGLTYAEIGARSGWADWTVRKHLNALQQEAS